MGTLVKVLTMCLLATVAVGSFWVLTVRPTAQPERAAWVDVAHDWKEGKRF